MAEYHYWYFGNWREDLSSAESYAVGKERYLARNPRSDQPSILAEFLVGLARVHLDAYEYRAANACVLETFADSSEDRQALEEHWVAAEQHLVAAFERAEQASRLAEHLDTERLEQVRCVHTVAGARLGRLSEALAVAEQLDPALPCSAWALMIVADALDGEARYVEAEPLYRRVAATYSDNPLSPFVTCPVAPLGPHAHIPGLGGAPNPYSPNCRWDRYVRYRLVWSELRRGLIDHERAADSLRALAGGDAPGSTLSLSIAMDVERWQRGTQHDSP